MNRGVLRLVLAAVLALPAAAVAQPRARPSGDAAVLQVRRLARSEHPAAAVAALLAALDAEAARTAPGPGVAGALHEALVVLTAHDPLPERALDDDAAWATAAARQELARAWHALLDPAAAQPFGALRRAGLASAREAFWGSEPAQQFSLIRRLARARMDRHMVRLAMIALWDLGTESAALERARAFGQRHGLYPPTPAEVREHCRVYCCS